MIDGLSEDMSVHNPDIIYEKVASMSCKAAVKGHHTMSFQEANVLIDQLLDLETLCLPSRQAYHHLHEQV